MTILGQVSISFLVFVSWGSVTSSASDAADPPPQVEKGFLAAAVGASRDGEACDSGCEQDAAIALQLGGGAVPRDSHLEVKEKEADAADASKDECKPTPDCAHTCHTNPEDCKRIIIIRHGERQHKDTDPLSVCGWERAWNYSYHFGKNSKYHVNKIYAFNYEQSQWPKSKQRAAQTASFLSGPISDYASPEAVPHHIHWGSCHCTHCKSGEDRGENQDKELAHKLHYVDMKGDAHTTITVFWEHENIKPLLKALTGCTKLPSDRFPDGEWHNWDFDSYLEVYYLKKSNHHCHITGHGFGIHPAQRRKINDPLACKECHEDGNPYPFCSKRTPTQMAGNISIGECPN